jgi:hypothetical protein
MMLDYVELEPGWLALEIERTRQEVSQWPAQFRNLRPSTEENSMSLESELAQFIGGGDQYEHFTKMRYTEGVKHLADNAGAYWLIDAIASYQHDKRLKPCGTFQLWELTVDNGTGKLECRSDSGEPALITQEIEHTDFPLKAIKLYVEHRVLMLPGEY